MAARRPNGGASARARGCAKRLGLEVHAGHGLDYATAETIAALPEIVELNIGHFLVGEAIFDRARRDGQDDARRHGPRPRAGRHGMIIGIGSDLVDIRRIERVIERHGERFLDAHLHRHRARQGRAPRPTASRPMPSASPPRRPAPRRSAPGMRAGVFWRDMGVVNLPSGRPTMKLTGGALRRLEAITPAGYEARIDLTITDEGPLAQAFVVISRGAAVR